MTADHGDRGAQLVADVVEQVALGLHRGLDPVEHPVDGRGQRRQVVPALDRHPGGQVLLTNGLGGSAQLLNGAKEPFDGEPGQTRHQGDGEHGRRRVEGHGAPELGLGDLEVDDVHERAALGSALQRDDEDPVARGGGAHCFDDGLRGGGLGRHPSEQLLVGAEGDVVRGDPGQLGAGIGAHEAELGLTAPLGSALDVGTKNRGDVLQGLTAGGVLPVGGQLADPVAAVLEPVGGIGRYAGLPPRPHNRPAHDQRDAGHQHDGPHDTGANGDGTSGQQ